MAPEVELRTPAGNRTSVGWTLYQLSIAECALTALDIKRRRAQRVAYTRTIWRHLRGLKRAGYAMQVGLLEPSQQPLYQITDAGMAASRG